MPDAETTPPASAGPLFAQVEANLRQRIVTNELAAGSKLPSEAELEREFGVSRITIRQALDKLHAKGLIQKINGKGSFVTRPTDLPDLGPLTGFFDHMRAKGHQAHGKTLSVREIDAPEDCAKALGVAPGSRVLSIKVLRIVDGKPLAYGIVYGQPELLQAVLQEDIETNDVMTLFESRLGFRLKNTHVETSALLAGKARAKHLQIAAEAPLMRVKFTPHDVNDRPLMHADMYFRADGFTYKAVVRR